MRLFLAIDLDDPARAAAAAWSQALSTRLGTAAAREIKWVEPANLHLSLHFFGELDDVRRDAVTRALGAPFATRAFAIALTGAGVFPPTGAPRVIWLGIRDSAESSAHTIYREVQARLTPLGLQETATRGFTPHLTIGRVRTPGAALGRQLRDAMRDTPAPPASTATFSVSHLTLYQSRLSPKGPTYVPIARFPLPA